MRRVDWIKRTNFGRIERMRASFIIPIIASSHVRLFSETPRYSRCWQFVDSKVRDESYLRDRYAERVANVETAIIRYSCLRPREKLTCG